MTLVGVPGIGKSRLVHELWRRSTPTPISSPGAAGARCRTARASPTGRSGRSSRRRPGSSSPTTAARPRRSSRRRSPRCCPTDGEAAWVERHLRPLVGLPGRRGDAGRATRRSPPGAVSSRRSPSTARRCSSSRTSTGPTTICSTSSTSSPTGSTRCRFSSSAPPAPSCCRDVRGGAGASRTPPRCRSTPLSDDGHGTSARRPARPLGAARRDAGGSSCDAPGRPALRRGVRPDARAGEATARCPRRCRGSSPRASTGSPHRGEGAAAGRVRARQGVLDGCARAHSRRRPAAVSTSACGRSSAASSSGVSGARRSKARASTSSCTRSCGTPPTGRSRAPPGRQASRAAEWIAALPPDRAEDRAEMLVHHLESAIALRRGRRPRGRRSPAAPGHGAVGRRRSRVGAQHGSPRGAAVPPGTRGRSCGRPEIRASAPARECAVAGRGHRQRR